MALFPRDAFRVKADWVQVLHGAVQKMDQPEQRPGVRRK